MIWFLTTIQKNFSSHVTMCGCEDVYAQKNEIHLIKKYVINEPYKDTKIENDRCCTKKKKKENAKNRAKRKRRGEEKRAQEKDE